LKYSCLGLHLPGTIETAQSILCPTTYGGIAIKIVIYLEVAAYVVQLATVSQQEKAGVIAFVISLDTSTFETFANCIYEYDRKILQIGTVCGRLDL
jgi:hypothetical protein